MPKLKEIGLSAMTYSSSRRQPPIGICKSPAQNQHQHTSAYVASYLGNIEAMRSRRIGIFPLNGISASCLALASGIT